MMNIVPSPKTCSDDDMQLSLTKIITILVTFVLINPQPCFAQDTPAEENSLENELSLDEEQQAVPAPSVPQTEEPSDRLEAELQDIDASETSETPETSVPAQTPDADTIMADKIIVDPANLPPDAVSEIGIETEGKQVESIEQEYLMNGYSIGATFLNHNYNVYANALINESISFDASTKTSDYQSVGVVGRYAIFPYSKIGTDINISLANSINHENINTSSILTIRGELNIAYTFPVGKTSAFYLLGGLSYDVAKGKNIEEILVPGGGGFQAGAGLSFSKKVDFEFLYSYVSRAVSEKYFANVVAAAMTGGATSVTYNSSEASVVSNVLMGRVTYNF